MKKEKRKKKKEKECRNLKRVFQMRYSIVFFFCETHLDMS